MNKKIEHEIDILYSTHYFERDLFVLNIDGKTTMVYRSSGLNGGRKGRILPFMYLNTHTSFSSPSMGYIFKEFLFDKKYQSHKKQPNRFPGLEKLLVEIEEKISFEQPIIEDIEPTNKNIEKIAINVNSDLKKILENKTFFDFKNDNKYV